MRFSMIVLLTFLSSVASAQSLPYFYRVTSNGLESYLLGTIHMGLPLGRLDPVVPRCMKQASSHYAEISALTDTESPGMSEISKLQTSAPLSLFFRLRMLFYYGLSYDFSVKSKEFTCAQIFWAYWSSQKIPELDMEVEREFHSRNIPTIALDTVELRAEADKLNDRSLFDERGIKPWEQMCDVQRMMNFDYLNFVVPAEKYLVEHLTQDPEPMNREDVDYRNRAWMPKLTEAVQKGGAFISVGAGHLAGPEGLIELLRKQGFTVEKAQPTDCP